MKSEEKKKWIEANKEAKAILALEGLYPDEISDAIEKAVLEDRMTDSDAVNQLLEYIKEHQKLESFLESRTWMILSS